MAGYCESLNCKNAGVFHVGNRRYCGECLEKMVEQLQAKNSCLLNDLRELTKQRDELVAIGARNIIHGPAVDPLRPIGPGHDQKVKKVKKAPGLSANDEAAMNAVGIAPLPLPLFPGMAAVPSLGGPQPSPPGAPLPPNRVVQQQQQSTSLPICKCGHDILRHISEASAMMACRDSHCTCGKWVDDRVAQLQASRNSYEQALKAAQDQISAFDKQITILKGCAGCSSCEKEPCELETPAPNAPVTLTPAHPANLRPASVEGNREEPTGDGKVACLFSSSYADGEFDIKCPMCGAYLFAFHLDSRKIQEEQRCQCSNCKSLVLVTFLYSSEMLRIHVQDERGRCAWYEGDGKCAFPLAKPTRCPFAGILGRSRECQL